MLLKKGSKRDKINKNMNNLVVINEEDKIMGFKKQVRIFHNHIFRSRAELMLIRYDVNKMSFGIDKYLSQKRLIDLENRIYKQELYLNIVDEVIGKVVKTLNIEIKVDFINK